MNKLMKEFREFVTTGNLIGIAIGILMGIQVGAVVTSFTENLFTPIFAMIGGKPDFNDALILEINDAQFRFGAFITDILNFLIIAAVAFILLRTSMKLFPPKPVGESEKEILADIRDALKAKND